MSNIHLCANSTLPSNAMKFSRMESITFVEATVRLSNMSESEKKVLFGRIDAFHKTWYENMMSEKRQKIKAHGEFKLYAIPKTGPITLAAKYKHSEVTKVLNSIRVPDSVKPVFMTIKPPPIDWKMLQNYIRDFSGCEKAAKLLTSVVTSEAEKGASPPLKHSIAREVVARDPEMINLIFQFNNQKEIIGEFGVVDGPKLLEAVVEMYSTHIVSTGNPKGFYDRLQTSFGSVRHGLPLTVQLIADSVPLNLIKKVSLTRVIENDPDIRDASMGFPFIAFNKTDKDNGMDAVLVYMTMAILSNLADESVPLKPFFSPFFVSAAQAKREFGPVNKMDVKVRPYYVYSGPLAMIFSKLAMSLGNYISKFWESESSHCAIGFSYTDGGTYKLVTALKQIRAINYADDVVFSCTINGIVWVGSADISFMDMSIFLKDSDTFSEFLKEYVFDQSVHSLVQGWCRYAITGGEYVVVDDVPVEKDHGLCSGVPGTSYFDHLKIAPAMREWQLFCRSHDFRDVQQVIDSLIKLFGDWGLVVKPSSILMNQHSDINWIVPFLGYRPACVEGVWLPRPDTVRLLAKLGFPGTNNRKDRVSKIRLSLDRIQGLAVSGGWFHESVYNVMNNIYKSFKPVSREFGYQGLIRLDC